MTHLLDVNVLLAAIILWQDHPHHARTFLWLVGKRLAVCPLVELGFVRISTNPKAIHAPMNKSRDFLLHKFLNERDVAWIPDDLPALDSCIPKKPNRSPIFTFAALAAHDME